MLRSDRYMSTGRVEFQNTKRPAPGSPLQTADGPVPVSGVRVTPNSDPAARWQSTKKKKKNQKRPPFIDDEKRTENWIIVVNQLLSRFLFGRAAAPVAA